MSSIAHHPLFSRLDSAERVLIAGCGGGFDIYCGLPLALVLRSLGKHVSLANLTFASPRTAEGADLICEGLVAVDDSCSSASRYFPELYLAHWLRSQGLPTTVYCLERTGVAPLMRAYRTLIDREAIDVAVLVDGGTDALMRGDEAGLGTPHEDVASLLALDGCQIESYLACLGFGIDAFHGVCHAHFLENTAALTKSGAFLGAFSLLPTQDEVRKYLSAVDFATQLAPGHASIVNTSIAAAVRGEFGDHHSTARTQGSELFINPLMAMYWCYELRPVVERLLYKDPLLATETWTDVIRIVEGLRKALEGTRPRKDIPC